MIGEAMSKSRTRKSNIQSIVVAAKRQPSLSTGNESSPTLSQCQGVPEYTPEERRELSQLRMEEWKEGREYFKTINPYKHNTPSWREWEKAAGR